MTTTTLDLKRETQEFTLPGLKNALHEYTARRGTNYTFTIYTDGDWWYEPCLKPVCGVRCGACGGLAVVRLASSRTGAVRHLAKRTASPYDWRTFHGGRTDLYAWYERHPDLAYDLARVRTGRTDVGSDLKHLALLAGRRPLTPAEADQARALLEAVPCPT